MKRSFATAAVCGVSLFGFTAVAGAASPSPPNPSDAAIDVVGPGACQTVLAHNPNVQGNPNFPGKAVGIFDGGQVYTAFCVGS